jgi:hypothetical protein
MTIEYFSVDRRGCYKTGTNLGLFTQIPTRAPLQPVEDFITQQDLELHLSQLFPNGLSQHGWDYITRPSLLQPQAPGPVYADYSVTLELVIEYVRRAAFANCTSRLQSYFAFSSLEEAKIFRSSQGPNASNLPVYRIHSDKVMKADQRWLRLGTQNAIGSFAIHKFWSGAAATRPKWEYMLAAPVRVLEQVV